MRISPTPPRKCTGCYSSKRDQVHVDFESAFDGPLIDPERPRSGHIEWLALCQDCVERAYALLPERRDHLTSVKEQLVSVTAELERERNYSARMEDTLQHRPRKPAKKAPVRRAA